MCVRTPTHRRFPSLSQRPKWTHQRQHPLPFPPCPAQAAARGTARRYWCPRQTVQDARKSAVQMTVPLGQHHRRQTKPRQQLNPKVINFPKQNSVRTSGQYSASKTPHQRSFERNMTEMEKLYHVRRKTPCRGPRRYMCKTLATLCFRLIKITFSHS